MPDQCPHGQPVGGLPSRYQRAAATPNRCECCDRIIANAYRWCMRCERDERSG